MNTFLTNPFAIAWKKKLDRIGGKKTESLVVDEEQNNEPWTDLPEYDKDGLPSE